MMKSLLLACTLLMIEPVSAVAGPKEDAFQVIEQFKVAFDASDVQGIVKLFARDAAFLGTISPKLVTTTEEIDAYFQGIKTDTPRKITIGDYSTLIHSIPPSSLPALTYSRERTPARFTFVITKGDQGWRISHFHSSLRPNPQ